MAVYYDCEWCEFSKKEAELMTFLKISGTNLAHRLLAVKVSAALQQYYVVGSKSFRPDTQKPRQIENAVRDI